MKHNKHHDNAKGSEHPLMPVTFAFTNPTADRVSVAGTFNDWHPEAKVMHPVGGGRWLKETALLPGTHEYCLVIDGRYIAHPLVKQTVANPFGGRNSNSWWQKLRKSAGMVATLWLAFQWRRHRKASSEASPRF